MNGKFIIESFEPIKQAVSWYDITDSTAHLTPDAAYKAFLEHAEESGTATKAAEWGPIGFPRLYGLEGISLSEWFHQRKVMPGSDQADYLMDSLGSVCQTRKQRLAFPPAKVDRVRLKNEAKKLKQLPNTEASLLTALLTDPHLRGAIFQDHLHDSIEKDIGWFLLKAAQRWLGYRYAPNLKAFAKIHSDYELDVKNGLFSYIDDDNGWEASVHNLAELLITDARRWDSLNTAQKNGILLGIWICSSFIVDNDCLFRACAIHPDIQQRLRQCGLPWRGLVEPGSGNHTILSLHSLHAKQLIGHPSMSLLGACEFSLAMLPAVKDLLEHSETATANIDLLESSSTAERLTIYKTAVKKAYQELAGCLGEAVSVGSDYKSCIEDMNSWRYLLHLYDDQFLADLPAIQEDKKKYFEELSGTPDQIAYWRKRFDEVAKDLEDPITISTKISNALNQNGSMKELKENISKAVESLDTNKIDQINQKISNSVSDTVYIFTQFITRLKISDDLFESAKEIGSRVDEEITPVAAENSALDEVENLRRELQESRTHSNMLKRQINTLEARCNALKQKYIANDSSLSEEVYRAISGRLTMTDLYKVMLEVLPGNTFILESVEESLKNSLDYRAPYKVLDTVLKIAGPYSDELRAGKPDSETRDILGSRYRSTESESTLSAPRLKRMREQLYRDQPVLFEQHMTLGSARSTTQCIQIYFKMLNEVMVIAYIGPHLETSSSST
ncbi:hypothetical protein [Neptunomonas sp.]|uniref:hypothetical protein n=1 Tax=Neptunomonas sp. TaxID=1971898 RepID=UPI0035673E6A